MQGLCSDIKPWSNYRLPFYAKMLSMSSSLSPENERQRSVNDLRPCILEYQGAVRLLWSMIELAATFLGKNAFDDFVTMPWKCASMERQWFYGLHLGMTSGYETTLIHNWTIGRLSRQQCFQWFHHYALTMSVNGPSTMLCLASWNIMGLWDYFHP